VSGTATQPVYVLRLSVVGAELNLHVLPRGLYLMHVSARASVHETVAMTDGVVGESLIVELNAAPRPPPTRHSLINGVQGSIQHLMMACDISADRSGTAASMVLPDSRSTPTKTKVVARSLPRLSFAC